MATYVFGKIGNGKAWHIAERRINVYCIAHFAFTCADYLQKISTPSDILSILPQEPICKTCLQWFKYNRPEDYHAMFGNTRRTNHA